MTDPRELYILAYEALLDLGLSEERAAEMAYSQMRDRLADIGDAAKDRAKEDGTWPPKTS
jgi:hypothetical protein